MFKQYQELRYLATKLGQAEAIANILLAENGALWEAVNGTRTLPMALPRH